VNNNIVDRRNFLKTLGNITGISILVSSVPKKVFASIRNEQYKGCSCSCDCGDCNCVSCSCGTGYCDCECTSPCDCNCLIGGIAYQSSAKILIKQNFTAVNNNTTDFTFNYGYNNQTLYSSNSSIVNSNTRDNAWMVVGDYKSHYQS
jgi:hypothetical protein